MDKKKVVLEGLLHQKILPLYYHDEAQVSIDILSALYDAGIRLVEYTNRGENALRNFMQLRKVAHHLMPGMLLGIGTIKNAEQATAYIDAGVDYIVCPSTSKRVGELAEDAGILWIPGCMTPTEIATAENAGAKLVKIFPGNILGPAFVTAVKDLFPGLLFIPTGGVEVTEENLKAWFAASVSAVGMGSKLISKTLVDNKDYAAITRQTKDVLQLIHTITA